MYDHKGSGNERDDKMERVKTSQRGIIQGITASQPMYKLPADIGKGTKKIRNHRRSSKTHLTPWENITKEGRSYYQKQQEHTRKSSTAIIITPKIQTAADMSIDTQEEKRSAISMKGTNESTMIHVSNDMIERRES